MNGGVGYITTEISQKGDGLEEGGLGENEKGPWDARGARDSSPRARGPFSLLPGTLGRLIKTQLLDPLSTNSL